MTSSLSNARLPGEKFEAYRERRRAANAGVKRYLRGAFAHVSAQIVRLGVPLSAEDEKLVERGIVRDLGLPQLGADGKLFRAGRYKGTTFAYPDRRKHREAVLADRRGR